MTTDQAGKTLVYDAWGRPVAYKNGATTLESMSYDALGRKIVENAGTAHDLYFSQSWQILEEDWSGTANIQNVWSAVGIDTYVERDRDADGNTGNGLEERLYVEQDANGNVTALVDTSGTVQERYQYDPYGAVTILTGAWGARGSSSYAFTNFFQGARFDSTTGLDNFRNREYSPTLGRWIQNDPLSYAAGDSNTYRALGNAPAATTDPLGLRAEMAQFAGPAPVEGTKWTGPGPMPSLRPQKPISLIGAFFQGGLEGANDLFVQPVYRTGQFVYDIVPTAVDPTYQPHNPYFRQYINGQRGYLSTVGAITTDAAATVMLAEAGARGVGRFLPKAKPAPSPTLRDYANFGEGDAPLGGFEPSAPAPKGIPADGYAESAKQARDLARQLTSEEQMAEALLGKGEPAIGAGTKKPLLDAPRLAQEYGGQAGDWAKMTGESSGLHGVQTPRGANFEIHWYQNLKTKLIVELKTKILGH
jgi:RHS repeat-associated protein